MSLYELGSTGEGLLDTEGPRFAGNIRRPLFDSAVNELRVLGLSSFGDGRHRITDQGRRFFEQRFHKIPAGKGLHACVRRTGSQALEPMGGVLEAELSRSRRILRSWQLAFFSLGLTFILVMLGLALYA